MIQSLPNAITSFAGRLSWQFEDHIFDVLLVLVLVIHLLKPI